MAEYTQEQIRYAEKVASVLEMMSTGEKHDVFSTTLTGQGLYNFNPGNQAQLGVFTSAGVKPGMWNLTARTPSVLNAIPFQRSTLWQELLSIMTGVTASSGSNTINACAAAPIPGVLKTMDRIFRYGMVHMDTRTFDITQAGAQYNRAVMTREMYNNAAMENPFIPQLPGVNGESIVANEFRAAMYALGKAVEDAVVQVNISGVASSQTVADTVYTGIPIQWDGLATQIKTGYSDNLSGFPATSVDSDVQTFGALTTGNATDGRNIVRMINDVVYGRRELARKLNISSPNFALVMRGDLFREITRIWSEKLVYYQLTGAAATPIMSDGLELQRMRQEMQRGQYLVMDDGTNIQVIIDDALPRRPTANNTFQSDILILALNAGGVPLIHYEFFDMGNPAAADMAALGAGGTSMVLNGGLYRLFRLETAACVQWKIVARPRLILDAPFLSGRVDRVEYSVFYKESDAIVGQSYYRNGGVSYRTNQL